MHPDRLRMSSVEPRVVVVAPLPRGLFAMTTCDASEFVRP